MGFVTRLLVIPLLLLLGVQALSAERGEAAPDAVQQFNTQRVRYWPRMGRRAIRHDRGVSDVDTRAAQPAGDDRNVAVREYHLSYVKSKDVAAMVAALLSRSGVFLGSPEAKVGAAGTDAKRSGCSATGGEMLIVQDYEEVLKKIDRVIAKIDVQPAEVLIEAVIVEVTLKKDSDSGVNLALFGDMAKRPELSGNSATMNVVTGFNPASVGAVAEKAEDVQFLGFIHGETADALRKLARKLASMGG